MQNSLYDIKTLVILYYKVCVEIIRFIQIMFAESFSAMSQRPDLLESVAWQAIT